MTCAHVVYVALKKVEGVESVEVSLNSGVAAMKLKPGNTVSVTPLWELIRKKGYTPKSILVTVRGEVMGTADAPALKVSGTKLLLAVAVNASLKLPAKGETVTLSGTLQPGKLVLNDAKLVQ